MNTIEKGADLTGPGAHSQECHRASVWNTVRPSQIGPKIRLP